MSDHDYGELLDQGTPPMADHPHHRAKPDQVKLAAILERARRGIAGQPADALNDTTNPEPD